MPGLYTRVRAVFLTIDSAKVSGVVLSEPNFDARDAVRGYSSDEFGLATKQQHREDWAQYAKELAESHQLPLVVVGEQWTPHGLSRAAYASLCASWGLWLAALENAGVDPKRIVRVNPQTWRSAVFGRHQPKTREGLKTLAVQYVHKALGAPPNVSHDIAEAMCLRVWAERAAEVHAVLEPKKKKRKAA